jgi:hypothetical protein
MKYRCSNGHENYADAAPEHCPVCGSSLIRLLSQDSPAATPVRAVPQSAGAAQPAPSSPNPEPVAASIPVKSRKPVRWIAFAGVGVLVVVLGLTGWLLRRSSPQKSAVDKPSPVSATNEAVRSVEWTPVVLMGGEIFPSYLIASATADPVLLPQPKTATRLGDPTGLLGVQLTNPEDQTKVRVSLGANSIMQTSALEVELPRKGESYLVCPKINYQYDALLRVKQVVPLALNVEVTIGGARPEQKSLTLRLNSINDCPFLLWETPAQQTGMRFHWMFAAYVNENHPWSEEVRRKALNTGIIKAFSGYQAPPEGVLDQAFSIWHVFQSLGFKYSDITTTSSENKLVATQQVRFVDQSIRGPQANCADGSVLFASVLRQIGVEPFLVSIPGHMFVGFYTSEREDLDQAVFLETTMMGDAAVQPKAASAAVLRRESGTDSSRETMPQAPSAKALSALRQRIEPHLYKDAAIQKSYDSFQKAMVTAEAEFKQAQATNQAQIISIRATRKKGVTPIAYQP